MTVKDICTVTGLSDSTVQNKIKELFPERYVKGKRITLTQEQSFKVVGDLRKKGFVTPIGKDSDVAPINWEINLQAILQHQEEISQRQQEMYRCQQETFLKGIAQIVQAITTTQRALPQPTVEITQDYYSILGYCRLKEISITWGEAVKFGNCAKRESEKQGYAVERVPDESYGYVGSYHINVLDKVFEM
jgi:hypothetical protein